MVLPTTAKASHVFRILRTKSKHVQQCVKSSQAGISRTTTQFSPMQPTLPTSRGIATFSTPAMKAASATAGQTLASLASDSPHKEVIRYEHKNVKWTLRHVEYFADCLAVGLLENGLTPGDAMLSWLPSHFSEQHILQFACSKAGFVLYNLDPSLALTDPAKAKEALAKALEISEATCLFTQEAGNDLNYITLVKEVIPEIRIFAFDEGMPFFTPRFPHLRFPIHTGFERLDKEGMMSLKHMLVPSGELDNLLNSSKGGDLTGNTPLLGEFVLDSDGIPQKQGEILSNDKVVKSNVWPELSSILKKEYTEVQGVGVVF